MGSSSASSSQPSARVPSPSPSPRSMRFGSSRHNSLVQQPSSASSSFLPLPPAANGIRIPHSQADLDRLHMERQLGELSMMSSSRASSSFLSRSSNHPDDDGRSQTASHPSQDDFGSSVEFARAPSPGGNLSAQGAAGHAAGSSFGQSSFNTTHTAHQHAPSPVSTNGHHASAITLRTGLVGSGLPAFRGQQGGSKGFDDDRELGKMLGGSNPQQRAFSFGLSDLGFPSSGKDDAPTPRPTKSKKLTDALARSFSPARHSARVPSPLAAGGHPSRGQRSATEESLFTTLARGVEDQLRPPLQSHPSPSQFDTGGHLRRSSSAGNNGTKKKRDVSAQLGRRASQNRSRAVSGGGIGQTSICLPDVTGLTEAVGETPLRAAPRQTTLHEGREEPHRPFCPYSEGHTAHHVLLTGNRLFLPPFSLSTPRAPDLAVSPPVARVGKLAVAPPDRPAGGRAPFDARAGGSRQGGVDPREGGLAEPAARRRGSVGEEVLRGARGEERCVFSSFSPLARFLPSFCGLNLTLSCSTGGSGRYASFAGVEAPGRPQGSASRHRSASGATPGGSSRVGQAGRGGRPTPGRSACAQCRGWRPEAGVRG